MYDELIEQLKSRASWIEFAIVAKPSKTDGNGDAILFLKAADAIEELQTVVDGLTAQTSMVFEKTEGRTVIKFEPKWIPVTERLPDKYVSVWTYSKFGMLQDEYIGEYDGENYFARQTTHVTHWQPLPEPPKEEA